MGDMHDLRQSLKAPGLTMQYGEGGTTEIYSIGGVSAELPSGAAHSEIVAALMNPFETSKKTEPAMTIAEQLKAARAQLQEARQAASDAVTESADASRVVMQEVEKARKEAADLRAEVAELTNGGPE